MSPYQLAAVVLLITFTVYTSVMITLFIRRRHRYPIEPRLPAFCLLQQATFALPILHFTIIFYFDFNTPCIWYHWITILETSAVAAGYATRVIHLFVRYKIIQELMQRNQDASLAGGQEIQLEAGWWTQRQRYITPKYLIKYFVNLTIGAIPLSAIFYLCYPHTLHILISDPTCPLIYSFQYNIPFAILAWGASLIILALAYRGKEMDEGLWVRKEFFIGVASVTMHHILMYIPQINRRHEVEALSYMVLMHAFASITYTLPVYATVVMPHRKRQRGSVSQSMSSYRGGRGLGSSTSGRSAGGSGGSPGGLQPLRAGGVRLMDYLQQPPQFLAFQNFLAKEFAVENLIFLKDVKIIKDYAQNNISREQPAPDVTLYQMVQSVYKIYIARDASQSINIGDTQREGISKEFHKLTSESVITRETLDTLFKPAVKEVVAMLECGAFLRFQNSGLFISPSMSQMSQLVPVEPQSPISPMDRSQDISILHEEDMGPITPASQMELFAFTQEAGRNGQMSERERDSLVWSRNKLLEEL